MSGSEHWMVQGRQEHGWFGHGTAPPGEAGANSLFEPGNAADRVDYAATSLIGHVPRAERALWSASIGDVARDRLKTAVAAWYGARGLDRAAFEARLLDPHTSDDTVDRLRRAARGIVEARTYDDLSRAGDDLGAAARQIGPDRWPGFLANAQRRAFAAVTEGQVPGVIKADADMLVLGAGAVAIVLGGIFLTYKPVPDGTKAPRTPTAPDKSTTFHSAPPHDEKKPSNAPAPDAAEHSKVVPLPPPEEGETPADVLRPNGQSVGKDGSGSEIRELPGGQEKASELFKRLTKGGTVVEVEGLPGVRVVMPNKDSYNYRPKSKSGPLQ